MNNSDRVQSLDIFRGVAAIAVVLYHFQRYLAIPWTEFAFVAVDLFFVLSGIVLAMKYAQAIEDGMPFRRFASLRLQRLYPMAFIAGAFVVCLDLAGVPSGLYVTAQPHRALRLFLLAPVMTSSAWGSAFPADGPAWSLWAELAVNAIWFPFARLRWRWLGVAGVLALCAIAAQAWHGQTLNFGFQDGVQARLLSLVRAFGWFSVGCGIALVRTRFVLPTAAALALFGGVTAACVLTHHEGWRSSLAIAAVGCVLLHSLYRRAPASPRLAGAARLLGMISFPLYLIHAPAGRLLPEVASPALRWVALVVVIGGVTALATWGNEALVRRVRELVERRSAGFLRVWQASRQ